MHCITHCLELRKMNARYFVVNVSDVGQVKLHSVTVLLPVS